MSTSPWHKRYHSDAIAGYMDLTLEERGAYTTLLDMMYDRGEALVDNERLLAGFLGVSLRKYRQVRDALVAKGKLLKTDDRLTNKRFEKEREKSAKTTRKLAENGTKGGEKTAEIRKKANENNGPPQQGPQQTGQPIPEARSQKLEIGSSGSNEPGISDAEKANAWLFAKGLTYLTENGIAERQARGLLGKWRKAHSDMATMQAVTAAMKVAASSPVPYIEAVLKRGNPVPVVVTEDGRKVRSLGP